MRASRLVDGGSRLTVRTHRPLGTSETHSDRMECTANGWGTFIGIIALMKITVALTGGKTTLAKTLGALSVAGNIWTIKVFLPMNDLMEAYGAVWRFQAPHAIHATLSPSAVILRIP